jgi:hypothetical protein
MGLLSSGFTNPGIVAPPSGGGGGGGGLVNLPNRSVHFPRLAEDTDASATTSLSLNATTTRHAQHFYAEKALVIDKVMVLVGNTGAVTAGTFTVRIETYGGVNASNTLFASGATGTGSVTAINTLHTITLDTPVAIPRGSKYSILLVRNDPLVCGIVYRSQTNKNNGFPCASTSGNGSTYTKQNHSFCIVPCENGIPLTVGRFGGFANGMLTYSNNNTYNPHEFGWKIKVPSDMRVVGLATKCQSLNAGYEMRLYRDTTLLKTVDFTAKGPAGIASVIEGYFDEPVLLEKDEWVRVTTRPTTATLVNLTVINHPEGAVFTNNYDAIMMSTFGMDSSRLLHTQKTNAGVWTDDTSIAYPVALIIDQVGA